MSKEKIRLTVFDQVSQLCDQWERVSPLPMDARWLLAQLAKGVVLAAADQCELRASAAGKHIAVANEARKCAMQIRHNLLCDEGESVCIDCDGEGCERCALRGTKSIATEGMA